MEATFGELQSSVGHHSSPGTLKHMGEVTYENVHLLAGIWTQSQEFLKYDGSHVYPLSWHCRAKKQLGLCAASYAYY